MFVIINDNIYPKDVRPTTFNSELPDILASDSAFISPIVNKDLYEKSDSQIIEFVNDEEKEQYYRYFIPFHEIEDSGFRIYVIAERYNVKLLVCKIEIDNIVLLDRIEMPIQEYNNVKQQVIEFYNNCNF